MGMSVEYNEEMDEACPLLEWEEDMINLIKWEVSKKSPMMRQALHLYFFRGYKPREIVQIVDMSNAYIRTSVKEFKQEMQKRYGEMVWGQYEGCNDTLNLWYLGTVHRGYST